MLKVSLRPITQKNLNECISLKAADRQQNFIASNVKSLERRLSIQHFILSAFMTQKHITRRIRSWSDSRCMKLLTQSISFYA